MRYVAINELSLDDKWVAAAEEAAKAVRKAKAKDRSRVIDEHQEVWADLKEALRALSHEKCWYCESIDIRSDNAVDHYRPKGNVKDAHPPHGGYWWLAFDWRNYRFTCTYCNSIRKSDRTSGGKQDYFPLWKETDRARSYDDDVDDELPLLIDPTNPIDVTLLAFANDGSVGPAIAEDDALRHRMAKETIRRYHLDHPLLTERRAETLRTVRHWVEEADKQLARFAKRRTGVARSTAKSRMQDITRAVAAKAAYSTAVKHLLAAMATQSDAARSVLKVL